MYHFVATHGIYSPSRAVWVFTMVPISLFVLLENAATVETDGIMRDARDEMIKLARVSI